MAAEDRTAPTRLGVRRALALAGVLMALAALVVFAVGPSGDPAGPVPEAGSRFRDEATPGQAMRQAQARAALERAVAQLFVAGFDNDRAPAQPWGGLLVTQANFASARQLRALTRMRERDLRRAGADAPLVIADPIVLGDLGPAEPTDLGAQATPADARTSAARAGRRVRRAGVDAVLAPSADLGVEGGPAELRAFSDDPASAGAFAKAAVEGWRQGGVVPIPGRFPGEGAAAQDPLAGPAPVGLSLEELRAGDLRPFAAVASVAPAIQVSAALYGAFDSVTPATLLPGAVQLLRRDLRFRGAVVSADLISAQAATGEGIGQAAVDAFMAGCDLLVVPGGRAEQEAAYRTVLTATQRGRIPRSRVEESLRRIRALKALAAR